MTLPAPHLDDLLCFALYSAHNAMGRLYRPLLTRLGLTYPQYLVLVALWQQDDRRVSDLGADLVLESNTLTPLLKRMETAGLVDRRRDTADERSVRVTLTPAGRALEAEAGQITACLLDRAGGLPEDVAALTRRIRVLADQLNRAG